MMNHHRDTETQRRHRKSIKSSNKLSAVAQLLCFVFSVPLRLCGSNTCSKLLTAAIVLILTPTAYADRLHLADGTAIEVDAAWEDAQGVWYRRGGVTHLVDRARVHSIERSEGEEEASAPKGRQVAKVVNASATTNSAPLAAKVDDVVSTTSGITLPEPVWIYLVGGARVEVDEVTENPEGVWYKRGNLSIFIERSRIERIGREQQDITAAAGPVSVKKRERGWSTGSAKIDALIRQNGARYGVDPYLIFCVMEQESHFNSRALSPMGASGLMQLMPGTAARFGVKRPFDPAQNVMGGTRYLKELLRRFGGRVDLVLAGYNAGEGAVMKYGHRVPPYRETRDYVKRITMRYRGHENITVAARRTVSARARM